MKHKLYKGDCLEIMKNIVYRALLSMVQVITSKQKLWQWDHIKLIINLMIL